MMITEEFSFPIITAANKNCNNVVQLTVLPPLWTRSPSVSDHHRLTRRNKFFTRSFSHVEAQLLLLKAQSQDAELVEADIAEEKMDMLWEDFNTHESLPVPPHNDHHNRLQSPAVSVFSSPTCSPFSSPVVDLETSNRARLSSDPHPTSSADTKRCEEKEKEKEKNLAGAGAPGRGSFEGELKIRSSSNLMMIVPKENKKQSKKKKKKKKKEAVQESIVRMMKKIFLLKKNISAFKFHKNKN